MTTAILNKTIQSQIVQGWRLEHQDEGSAILSKGKRVNNILHLIVSLLLAPWAVVWLVFTLTGGVKRKMLTVNEHGGPIEKEIEGGEPLWAKIVAGIIVVGWIALLSQVYA